MNRIIKSRRGFALAEMILVIAIIVILASVITLSVHTYLDKAGEAKTTADSRRTSVLVNIRSSEANMNALGFGNTGTNVHNHNGAASSVAPS